jgi:hypothetical protein
MKKRDISNLALNSKTPLSPLDPHSLEHLIMIQFSRTVKCVSRKAIKFLEMGHGYQKEVIYAP